MVKPGQGEPARISFDLDRDLHRRLNKIMPWGIKAHIMRQLTTMFIDGAEKGGDIFIAAVLSGSLEFTVPDRVAQILNGTKDE